MISLRHKGIYEFPKAKRKVMAFQASNGTYLLYDAEYGLRLPPRYKVESDGNLINWFSDHPIWTVDDLVDTGETYSP